MSTPEVSVHFLDVGFQEYGDCVLCLLGKTSVLIDGSHPGDQVGAKGHQSIPAQLGKLLGQQGPRLHVDLLIVTHAHRDHIGCLPFLVEKDLLRADWALVADPDLGWARATDSAEGEPVDSATLHLVSALREEVLSDRADAAQVSALLADAASLEDRYRTMLDQLEARGTRVFRYGQQDPKPLVSAFKNVGLRILGPSRDQLLLCAAAIADATDQAVRAASDLLSRDDAPQDEVEAYRRLTRSDVDALDAPNRPGPRINLQSIVTRFDVGGVKLLFAGDMQFADTEGGGEELKSEVKALRAKIRKEAPFGLVKVSHHGSHNAFSQEVLDDLKSTAVLGICAGESSTSHPARDVLRLLDRNRDHLKWVRTDLNRLSTVRFVGGTPELVPGTGKHSDATAKTPDTRLEPAARRAPAAPEPARPARTVSVEPAVTGGGPAQDFVEVTARIPHTRTQVVVSVDITPGAPGAGDARRPAIEESLVAPGRDLRGLLFVTSRAGLVDAIGREETDELLTSLNRQGLLVYDELPGQATESADSIALVQAQLQKHGEALKGVVILGGYDVVPAQRLDCLTPEIRQALSRNEDPDNFIVWSDDRYGDREGDKLPELPVSRVPDGHSAAFLRAAVRAQPAARAVPRRGVRNSARPFADEIFDELPGSEAIYESQPTVADDPAVQLDADHVYLMLHGDYLDSTRFWGEQTASGREAVNLENIPDPAARVVFTGCCWGALIADQPAVRVVAGSVPGPKSPDASMALRFLARGATAFVGCTGAHYSPLVEPFGYFGGPMHRDFWLRVAAGVPPARALFEAKEAYGKGMPHGRTTAAQQAIELKTLYQYTCLGLGW